MSYNVPASGSFSDMRYTPLIIIKSRQPVVRVYFYQIPSTKKKERIFVSKTLCYKSKKGYSSVKHSVIKVRKDIRQ